ncbi:helix-turn-helix domain-containing protein [Micromonospora sp. WMMD967]|nr:helix-turn-helix domain-containing protein [Micromonospora sp. WMMD967]MDG4835509.1 helix-turn-helix domain-containing protein [Micromonospora sp. WMMD967]
MDATARSGETPADPSAPAAGLPSQADGVAVQADGPAGRADGITGRGDTRAGRADAVAGQAGGVGGRAGEASQTLDRGLRLLHLVADAPGGLTVTEAAHQLSIGRAAVYRLVSPLIGHGMLRRDSDGRLRLGAGLLHLARRAQPLLAEGALPALRRLAEQAGATAHLTVVEAGDGVALAVVEPSWTSFHVAYRTGARHPLDRGAAGRAILAGRSGLAEPVSSSGELQAGAYGVAAPVLGVPGLEASVGVVALAPLDVDTIGPQVLAAATAIASALS